MVIKLFSQWSDFSSSETSPLFWMVIGPLLLMATMIGASTPLLSLIALIGVIAAWRYRTGGFALSLTALLLYLSLSYLLGYREAFFWQVAWGVSLALGVTISFLSMEEVRSFFSKERERRERVLTDLHLSLQSSEEKNVTERRTLSGEVEELKSKQRALQDEVEVLLNLIEGSRIESEKVFGRSETLSSESLAQHREIETLKQELTSEQERLGEIQKSYGSLSLSAQERLKELNTKRVELHQAEQFIESYKEQIKRARDYLFAQKKGEPDQSEVGEEVILQNLEKEKGAVKKSYDQLQEDFLALKKTHQDERVKLEREPDEELSAEVERLGKLASEKKRDLEQARAELVSIEREIFITKKGLQERGSYVH
ncbi:MAG: hypothetical protein K1060chlam2_00196 [Chlamydiae bacterium]|nr:hypothetical protein [Chlamydiota bacterium]